MSKDRHNGYDEGYDDILEVGEYDSYKYSHDRSYRSGVEDALDELEDSDEFEDW